MTKAELEDSLVELYNKTKDYQKSMCFIDMVVLIYLDHDHAYNRIATEYLQMPSTA